MKSSIECRVCGRTFEKYESDVSLRQRLKDHKADLHQNNDTPSGEQAGLTEWQ